MGRPVAHGQATNKDRYATPEYRAWAGMKQRCTNPNASSWKHYGGRGIGYCERWELFEAFFVDVGLRPSDRHSLERLDSDKDYGPDNCVWATIEQQNRNRSNCKTLTIDGETRNIGEWAELSGVPGNTIYMRALRYGWSPIDAVRSPVGKKERTILRCVECNHDVLYGKVTIVKMIPLNQKGGGLNMKGQKIGQVDVKNAWGKDRFMEDKDIYGPIQCGDCGQHHVYIPGETPALRVGEYDEVMEGWEAFLEQGDDDEGN